jgi:tubulin polyglutamylase TTLL11
MEIYTPMMQYRLELFQKQLKNAMKGNLFQILGLDVIIDKDLKAWVLEINHNPSLDIVFDTSFMQHKAATEDDICPVDRFVKERVVSSAIKLSQMKSLDQVTSFETLKQVYPPLDRDAALSNLVLDL